jgi:hypothetical protein
MAVLGLLTWRGFIERTRYTESCMHLVADMGLISIERTYGRCSKNMHWERDVFKANGYRWQCTRQYRAACSLRIDTFFSKFKLLMF